MLGPSPNRPARESNRLRATRARERDKRDDGVAVRHASELSVLSTHQAEGLAVTIRGRGRGGGPYPEPPCPREQPAPRRSRQRARRRRLTLWGLVLSRTERTTVLSTYRDEGLAVTNRGRGVVLGPGPTRPAREIDRLRAARARERDKRDDGVAVRHASELSVRSTHRAEGLAATNRWRERGAGP